MASHFYQVCMGAYGETLFRSSKRDARQAIWLQCNLMRLGAKRAVQAQFPLGAHVGLLGRFCH